MTFLERIKERARADKKKIVLPESMDRRTFEAAETILKEDIADIIIIGTPEEVAYATIYLLSEASAWTTGTEIKLDGGLTLS